MLDVDDDLTPFEVRVLGLIASGWTNPRLSRRFNTTVGRAEQVRTSIYRKLGAVNAPHAVKLAYELHVFVAPPRQ